MKKPLDVDISDYNGSKDIDRFPGTVEDFEKFVSAPPVQENNTVSVVLMRDMIVNVTGKYTGRLYVFNGAGSVINNVDRMDAEEMINKNLTPSCCGSYPSQYFKIL